MNAGKNFEQEFRKSAENQELLCIRQNDSDLSFHANKELRSRFTLHNICDYILYYKGHIYFCELKSTHFNSISFDREETDKKMIRLHQINSLTNVSLFEGAHSGFVFNFRTEKEGVPYEEITYWMSIENFNNFYVSTDKCSINKLDIIQNGGIIIEAKQRRKYYSYNVKKMLEDIVKEQEDDEFNF